MDDAAPARPLIATCARGLENVLAEEVRQLDVESVGVGRGMVSFSGDLRAVYDANLRLRTAIRVLVQLARGSVASPEDLYDLTATVAWEEFIEPKQTFAVEVAGRARAFRNTTYAAQVVKDAVVDGMRKRRGQRPNVDRDAPDIRIHLHLTDRGVTGLGLDSSGEPLSHRGYRPRGGPAPLSESLAAGILLLAGYDGTQPILDPMCGTGTFAVEAALIATRTPPGLRREFAFERWPVHDRRIFEEVSRDASRGHRDAQAPILAGDRDERAVQATRRNLRAAWMDRWVTVERRDALKFELPWDRGGLVVANPPYGKRVGNVERLISFYRRFGQHLKRQAAGSTAYLLVGEPRLAKALGLRATRKIPLYNGPIECRLLRFDL